MTRLTKKEEKALMDLIIKAGTDVVYNMVNKVENQIKKEEEKKEKALHNRILKMGFELRENRLSSYIHKEYTDFELARESASCGGVLSYWAVWSEVIGDFKAFDLPEVKILLDIHKKILNNDKIEPL